MLEGLRLAAGLRLFSIPQEELKEFAGKKDIWAVPFFDLAMIKIRALKTDELDKVSRARKLRMAKY